MAAVETMPTESNDDKTSEDVLNRLLFDRLHEQSGDVRAASTSIAAGLATDFREEPTAADVRMALADLEQLADLLEDVLAVVEE